MLEYIATVWNKPSKMNPDLLGGKGFHLARMKALGLPVPDAAILTTEFFSQHFHPDKVVGTDSLITDTVMGELREMLSPIIWTIEHGQSLISVRSGAKISMPGMMDTILNVGITSQTKPALVAKYGEELVENLEGRLIRMYADVVFGVHLKDWPTVAMIREDYENKVGIPFFDTVEEQVLNAVVAVFESWYNERAIKYRDINGIPHDIGTAVVLQKMVYGNADDLSCTGVYFSSNPNTGAITGTGEYLIKAQGEDVVSGEVTPCSMDDEDTINNLPAPLFGAITELVGWSDFLEKAYGDIQDIEFTVESGKLHILQTRSAKRTDTAALQYVNNRIKFGLEVSKESKALEYVTPELVGRMFRETISESSMKKLKVIGQGLAVGGGIAQGKPVFDQKDAAAGTIFVTQYTTPDDLDSMIASDAVVTETGGATSHAAIVARSLGKPAVVGGGKDLIEAIAYAEWIVVDGDTGKVYKSIGGKPVDMVQGQASQAFIDFAKLVWGKEVTATTSYTQPFEAFEAESCVSRVFGNGSVVAESNTPKKEITEDDIPDEVKKFLKEVHLSDSVLKTILSEGFKVEESCYDKDPVVVALAEILTDKD